MTIYLYVKTHRKTGLKYLGKTTSTDPHAYHGSGGLWKAHLKEHGADYDTKIIQECQTNQELSKWGRYYSNLWNVVEDSGWANQIPETGGGGNHTEERKELFRQQQLGRKKATRTDTHKQNWTTNTKRKEQISALGKASKGRKHSQETLDKKSKAMKEYWAVKRAQVLQHGCKPVQIQDS